MGKRRRPWREPSRGKENMRTPYRKVGFDPMAFCCEGPTVPIWDV